MSTCCYDRQRQDLAVDTMRLGLLLFLSSDSVVSSVGIRVAAHQAGGVSGCRSDGQEVGFMPLNTRVNPSKNTDLGFQIRRELYVEFTCVM